MSIVFLDIDGVLNQLQGNYYLDINCIDNLVVLCAKLNANIVLTSSWRKGFSLTGKCTPQIQELLDILNSHGINIIGRTKELGDRATEIRDYIITHNIKDYIILDDDKSEFKTKIDNIYIVNYKTGLTLKDVKKIIKEKRSYC